jgi:hypothetical protein
MMVTNILPEQSLQMAFIQRNNLVQQVSLAAYVTVKACYIFRDEDLPPY